MLVQRKTVVTFLTKCLTYKLVCCKNQNCVCVCTNSQQLHHKPKSHAGSSPQVILRTFPLTSVGLHICARNKHYAAAPFTQQHTHTHTHSCTPNLEGEGPSRIPAPPVVIGYLAYASIILIISFACSGLFST